MVFKNKIKELEKGCGMEVKTYTKYKWYSKKFIINFCGQEGFYCDNCQAKLQGLKEGYDLGKQENCIICSDYKNGLCEKHRTEFLKTQAQITEGVTKELFDEEGNLKSDFDKGYTQGKQEYKEQVEKVIDKWANENCNRYYDKEINELKQALSGEGKW